MFSGVAKSMGSSEGVVASEHQSQNSENGVVRRERRVEMYSGPLPHPDLLNRYREIIPDAPERILRMAERQSEHRIEMERRLIVNGIWNERAGLVFGFIVCLTALVCGVLIVQSGYEGFGFAAIIAAIASPIAVFMYVKRREKALEPDSEISQENY